MPSRPRAVATLCHGDSYVLLEVQDSEGGRIGEWGASDARRSWGLAGGQLGVPGHARLGGRRGATEAREAVETLALVVSRFGPSLSAWAWCLTVWQNCGWDFYDPDSWQP